MLKKKLHNSAVFIFCLLLLSQADILYGQSGNNGYQTPDSSVIPSRRRAQQNEFMNNAYPFPAKPRSQWELGIKGGLPAAGSDVRYWGPTGGFGIHLRKALGYVFSIRAEFDWLRMQGLNWQPSQDWGNNPVLNKYYAPGAYVFYNYRTTVHELSLQGVVSLNNIGFHRKRSAVNAYIFGGIGAMTYSTFYKVLDNSGKPYDYSGIITQFQGQFNYSHRKDISKALKNLVTGPWSTMAERDNSQATLGGAPLRVSGVLGAGVEFKLSSRFNLALEDKFTAIKTDLLDGQQWQENGTAGVGGKTSQTRDYDAYNFFSLGLNINLGSRKRSVEPLWWRNPLEYAYNELNAPHHMKLPKPVLDDADGDGVTDQFDLEPNTPKGCPVDSHGVSRDTDGDGVPDCKDKELITPTQCQPVDANGVGKCPEPACCKDIAALSERIGKTAGSAACDIGDLPSITFKGRSVTLSVDARALLASSAEKLRNNPNCKAAVIGYGQSSKSAQQLSWDRVNAVINYLVEKEGIATDRFIFRYGQSGGEENTVDLKNGTGEQGPNTVPAPHPDLRKK
jgi:outer membrane protein OmpA-like peptidoglycan-associated protein